MGEYSTIQEQEWPIDMQIYEISVKLIFLWTTHLLLLPALPPLDAWTRMATATSTITTRTPAPMPSSVNIHGFSSRLCSLLSGMVHERLGVKSDLRRIYYGYG